jgi:hypothetical protein
MVKYIQSMTLSLHLINNRYLFHDNTGWGAESVSILASLGVVEGVGEGKFDPNANVTRAQTAVFIHRAEVPYSLRLPVYSI